MKQKARLNKSGEYSASVWRTPIVEDQGGVERARERTDCATQRRQSGRAHNGDEEMR